MEHRGKIIRERIEEFGVSKAFIYKKLKIDKKTFDRLLATHNPPEEMIERIGNIIRHDFSIDFPDSKKTVFESENPLNVVAETRIVFSDQFMKQVLSDLEEIKIKLSNTNQLNKPEN